jgi:hypothetical protein
VALTAVRSTGYLDLHEVAQVAGVTEALVRQYVRDNTIPSSFYVTGGAGGRANQFAPIAVAVIELMKELGEFFGANSPLPKQIVQKVLPHLERVWREPELPAKLTVTHGELTVTAPLTFLARAKAKLDQRISSGSSPSFFTRRRRRPATKSITESDDDQRDTLHGIGIEPAEANSVGLCLALRPSLAVRRSHLAHASRPRADPSGPQWPRVHSRLSALCRKRPATLAQDSGLRARETRTRAPRAAPAAVAASSKNDIREEKRAMTFTDVEVRTRSTPTAAHLLCMGFEPREAKIDANGVKIIVFPGAARATLDAYLAAKAKIDAWLESQ